MKLRFITTLGTALAFATIAAVSTQTAKADIITSLASQSSSGGMYNYTFSVLLTGDEEVSPSLGYAQFGTLYDLSTSSVSWSNVTGLLATDFSFNSAATNTSAYLTSAPDSASSWNLRYTYTGSATLAGPQMLGDFTISLPTQLPSMIFYDGEAGKSTGTPGNETGNVGSINIPSTAGAPEPATILLLGGGLLGIGFVRRGRFLRK